KRSLLLGDDSAGRRLVSPQKGLSTSRIQDFGVLRPAGLAPKTPSSRPESHTPRGVGSGRIPRAGRRRPPPRSRGSVRDSGLSHGSPPPPSPGTGPLRALGRQ